MQEGREAGEGGRRKYEFFSLCEFEFRLSDNLHTNPMC